MKIEFDPAKREMTLCERGLDFLDAGEVLATEVTTFYDERFAYPERRQITFGFIGGRLVAMVWTVVQNGIRVISLRKANEREQARYREHMD